MPSCEGIVDRKYPKCKHNVGLLLLNYLVKKQQQQSGGHNGGLLFVFSGLQSNMAPHFPNHPGKKALRFPNRLSQSDAVSRIKGPRFPNQGTSFPESSRCSVFPVFSSQGATISRIRGRHFPNRSDARFSCIQQPRDLISRIETVSGPEKGHLISRICHVRPPDGLRRQSNERKKWLQFQKI
jgi:hypothetical protein